MKCLVVDDSLTMRRIVASVLKTIGVNEVVEASNGAEGLAKAAPFDSIILAAAAPTMPLALLHQLARGGRMI